MEFESDFVQVIKLDPTYIRLEPNNLEVFSDTSFLKLIPYSPKSFSFIKFAPLGFGGNHYHSRIESFVAFGGEVELIYIEKAIGEDLSKNTTIEDQLLSDLKIIKLNPRNTFQLVTISSNVPHAVVNRSINESAFLLEWADKPQENVKEIKLV